MVVYYVRVYRGRGILRRWRWGAVARNGEQVAQGQAYTRKSSVIRAVKKLYPGIEITDKDGVTLVSKTGYAAKKSGKRRG